jgi:uncharacterized protein YceH (UPF0502 family)
MEKSVITPDQYPLSLNALVNACNQKSSREPVMSLEQGVVERTVKDLIAKQLVMTQEFGSRVEKYQQRFCNTHFAEIKFSPAEFAVVCLLLLRGPQTPGELKAHSGRLYEFAEGEAEATLESLLTRADGPFVARFPREPRRKDHAYVHLFGGPVESAPREARAAETSDPASPARPSALAALEARVDKLEQELAALKQALGITQSS